MRRVAGQFLFTSQHYDPSNFRGKVNRWEFKKPKATVGTFAEARLLYETDLANDYTLAEGSRQYRKARIAALLKSWPGLDSLKLGNISEAACRAWRSVIQSS